MKTQLAEASAKRSIEKLAATKKVLSEMVERGQVVNFYTAAEAAGVTRGFLYHHPELRSFIENCRITGMSKQALQQEVIRLRLQLQAATDEHSK